MAVSESGPIGPPPSLLGRPLTHLPLWAKLALLVLVVAGLAVAAAVASNSYPRSAAPQATMLERRIAEVMRDPTVQAWDDSIVGDLLVERFYILDLGNGGRYVADFLKGRIDGVEVVPREDEAPADIFLLNTKDMRRDKAFYNSYIRSVSGADDALGAQYLGVVTPTGVSDAFPVNYNGYVPLLHSPFEVGGETDIYAYLKQQDLKQITSPRGISVSGYTYVLSSSEIFALFKNEYKVDKAVFISEQLVIDATSRENKATYYKLLEQFPRLAGQ